MVVGVVERHASSPRFFKPLNRLRQRLDDFAPLRLGRAIRGDEHDDVADGAREHAGLRHGLADADARLFGEREWFARAPVFDQFDAGDEANLPDVAHGIQFPERLQAVAHPTGQPSSLEKRGARFEDGQTLQTGGRAELVGGVAMAVKKSFEFVVSPEERVEDGFGGQGRGHRQVTSGQSFG